MRFSTVRPGRDADRHGSIRTSKRAISTQSTTLKRMDMLSPQLTRRQAQAFRSAGSLTSLLMSRSHRPFRPARTRDQFKRSGLAIQASAQSAAGLHQRWASGGTEVSGEPGAGGRRPAVKVPRSDRVLARTPRGGFSVAPKAASFRPGQCGVAG